MRKPDMAIYTLPSMVSRIAGVRGGAVFQKSGVQYAIRRRVVPVNKPTLKRTAAANRLSATVQIWRTLTGSEQSAWAADALNYPRTNSLGDTYFITGSNQQTYVNVNQNLIDDTPITTPAAAPTFPAILIDTVGISMGSQIIEVVITDDPPTPDTNVPTGFSLKVYMGPPVSQGTTEVDPNTLRLLGTLAAGTDTAATNWWDQWVALFGPPEAYTGRQLTAAVRLVQAPGGIDDVLYTALGDVI